MSDKDDRPKRSWAEVDRLRDKPRTRDERKPRGVAAESRAKAATKEYLKGLDGLFSKESGGAEGEARARAVREAHGSPELAAACQAYLEAVGSPRDPSLLALFLDSDDSAITLAGLEGLLSVQERGELELSSGLRSQLRMLAQGFDDAVAEAAETLLEGA